MSNAVATPTEVRKQLRTIAPADFIKAHTLAALVVVANTLEIEIPEGTKTKQEHYDVIVAGANLPDPALRGESTIEAPVATVWTLADVMHSTASEEEPARRKDVVAACQEAGVAYYTARTQYQAWYTATDKGRRRLSELSLEELPKALHPVEEVSTDG